MVSSPIDFGDESKEERRDDRSFSTRDEFQALPRGSDPSRLRLQSSRDYSDREFPFSAGQLVDVLDSVNRWAEAEVVEVDRPRGRVFISYLFWSRKWDEWVYLDDRRLSPHHTHTYFLGGRLTTGQRLEVEDKVHKRLEAYVIAERADEVQVHYKDYRAKFDEWIPRDSQRIAPFGSSHARPRANRLSDRPPHCAMPEDDDGIDNNEGKKQHHPQQHPQHQQRRRQIEEVGDKYARYLAALETHGLRVVRVQGDGNCLFRAVSHQLYGDEGPHALLRSKCMDYMECDAAFFSQFVEGGLPSFALYVASKRLASCWGDDLEIQALSEIYDRPIEIWAYDGAAGARRLRTFHEAASHKSRPYIRLSYYGGGHYDSLVSGDHDRTVLTSSPGAAEDRSLSRQLTRRSDSNSGGGGSGLECKRGDADSSSSSLLTTSTSTSSSSSSNSEMEDLSRALRESRAEVERWGAADLERCLSLSLQQEQEQGEGQGASKTEIEAVEGQLVESVVRESERAFIEQALEAALVPSYALAADDLLPESSLTGVGVSHIKEEAEAEDVRRALQLSELSEEEVLQMALQQSLLQQQQCQQQGPTSSTTPSSSLSSLSSLQPQPSQQQQQSVSSSALLVSPDEDDRQLREALAASLGDFCGTSNNYNSCSSSGNGVVGNALLAPGSVGSAGGGGVFFGDTVLDDDEAQIQRAIAESLHFSRDQHR